VAFLPDGSAAFVQSESTGEINVIDTTGFKVSKVITLPERSRPAHVLMSPDGAKLYVSNGRAATVSVLDPHSYALLDTIKVGTRPWGIAVTPDGKFLYSANGPSNDVSVIDLKTNKEITRVKAGSSPWGVEVVPTAH
jgi:YVTN family beta-propeller protein